MTNGETIRSMSDEELTELFYRLLTDRDRLWLEQLKEYGIEMLTINNPPEYDKERCLEYLKTEC